MDKAKKIQMNFKLTPALVFFLRSQPNATKAVEYALTKTYFEGLNDIKDAKWHLKELSRFVDQQSS